MLCRPSSAKVALDTTFEVTMGSFELEESFLLFLLQNFNTHIRLYRGDGLAISNTIPRESENIKNKKKQNKKKPAAYSITTPTSPSQCLIFLTLVDKHFPKDHNLRKVFNRNTTKISYSCMNNTKQIIDNRNKCILNSSKPHR